jgi:uncharacterized protein with FMN-binding domain
VVSERRREHLGTLRNTVVLAASVAGAVAVLLSPTSSSSSVAAPRTTTSGQVVPLPSDLVVTGDTVRTRYGPVQVQLRVRKGRIIEADAVKYPMDGGLSTVVSGRAVAKLNKEVLRAQSGDIDVITTATYTSEGYQSSLQSALDQAHLA